MKLIQREQWPAWIFEAYPGEHARFVLALAESEGFPEQACLMLADFFSFRLVLGDKHSVNEEWRFHSFAEALAAMVSWDGKPPGPEGWFQHTDRFARYHRDPATGEQWANGCRKLWAVKVGGKLVWHAPPPQATSRELAEATARELGGEVVQALEHEIEGWW